MRSKTLPSDPAERKVVMRAIAGEILRQDRFRQKHGLNGDTGGEILRALERAYQAGLAAPSRQGDGPGDYDEPSPVHFDTIPAGPRQALEELCLAILGDDPEHPMAADCGQLIAGMGILRPDRTTRWRFASCPSEGEPVPFFARIVEKQVFSQKTLAPLLTLGLIELLEGSSKEGYPASLWLSRRGAESWAAHLAANPAYRRRFDGRAAGA